MVSNSRDVWHETLSLDFSDVGDDEEDDDDDDEEDDDDDDEEDDDDKFFSSFLITFSLSIVHSLEA